jgi:GNAT superfamily N-acetyltransferase
VTIEPSTKAAAIETASGHILRAATAEDLPTCARIWRESLNDYYGRLNLPEVPDDLAAILRLYDHLLKTDAAGFVVAERPDDASGQAPVVEAFAVAVVRDDVWFLSMLFVLPPAQGRGLGRALLQALLPDDRASGGVRMRHATSTDTAQLVSNGLYATFGLVPRTPLLRLVGRPDRPAAFPRLPDGIAATPFEEIEAHGDGLGTSALWAEIAALDRSALGFEHPFEHAFIAADRRVGFLYHDRAGTPIAYGYTAESGRVGPIAVSDSATLGGVIGHLVTAVRPRGAFGVWVPGAAGEAVVPLLRAGFRIDDLPLLLCWDEPFADFSRYIPNSPGLL